MKTHMCGTHYTQTRPPTSMHQHACKPRVITCDLSQGSPPSSCRKPLMTSSEGQSLALWASRSRLAHNLPRHGRRYAVVAGHSTAHQYSTAPGCSTAARHRTAVGTASRRRHGACAVGTLGSIAAGCPHRPRRSGGCDGQSWLGRFRGALAGIGGVLNEVLVL
jgi:hypothetical protein